MNIFNYIFYRFAKLFYKRDGSDAIRAVGIITIIQLLLLCELIVIILKIFFSTSEMAPYAKSTSKIVGVLSLVLLFINYKYYKGKYWRFSDKWRDSETKVQKKVRGYLVIVALCSPFIILLALGGVFS